MQGMSEYWVKKAGRENRGFAGAADLKTLRSTITDVKRGFTMLDNDVELAKETLEQAEQARREERKREEDAAAELLIR